MGSHRAHASECRIFACAVPSGPWQPHETELSLMLRLKEGREGGLSGLKRGTPVPVYRDGSLLWSWTGTVWISAVSWGPSPAPDSPRTTEAGQFVPQRASHVHYIFKLLLVSNSTSLWGRLAVQTLSTELAWCCAGRSCLQDFSIALFIYLLILTQAFH